MGFVPPSNVARSLALLSELPGDAAAIRARAAAALTATELGDGTGVFGFAASSPTVRHPLRWGLAEGAAQALYARALDPLSGRHAFGQTDLRLAQPIEHRSFRNVGQLTARGSMLESATWSELYEPARIWDQVRLLVTRDDEVVAYALLVRGVGAPLFGPAEARVLQRLVRPLQRALVAADAIERDGTPDGPADFVLDARGRVLFASREAQAWLRKSGFREHLARLVRAADRERIPSSTVGRGRIDLVRVHGRAEGLRYLAHVTPLRPLRLSPAAALTEAQREIAALLASGATVSEIATMVGRSVETVRSHLKAIYQRLGVSSRAELVRALEPDEPR
jgi:DNA-binding CsgD family transcriptional regulator